MENRMSTRPLLALAITALAAGCASMMPAEPGARATLAPTAGNQASGTVSFVTRGDKVRVSAKVAGLAPGPHGFHIHEKGDCSAPDATSAGGHFNPTGMQHGSPTSTQRHMGDFGNIEANASGIAKVSIVDHMISIEGPYTIIG